MRRSKKLILVAVLAAVVLVGSIGGIALAQTGTGGSTGKTLLARVATILNIDQPKLEAAFAQAQKEMRDEALTNRLNDLVKQGKMTQDQADQYQKWMQSKPNVPLPGFGPGGHMGFRGFRGPGPAGIAPTPTPTPK